MSMKRSSTSANEPTRPSKKRKSAEAGKAKIKQIAEDEDVADAAELLDIKEKTRLQVQDNGSDQEQRIVAPGFRVWNTTSKMTVDGKSQFDWVTKKHSMGLDIQNDEPFTLKPLVITQGPYKGYRVFMLESGIKFRFFDLPAEIRNLVYSFLVEEDEPIKMMTHKIVNQLRRPVRATYVLPTTHRGKRGDRQTSKRPVQEPSNLTVLRANKRVFAEVAPLVYDNTFEFTHLSDVRIFLERIGEMRQYVHHIKIVSRFFHRGQMDSLLKALKGATSLRTLSLSYHLFDRRDEPRRFGYGGYWSRRFETTPEDFAARAKRTMAVLHREIENDAEAKHTVLDIIKIDHERCPPCKLLAPAFATGAECTGQLSQAYPKCKDAAERCEDLRSKIRATLAALLQIRSGRLAVLAPLEDTVRS